MPCCFHSGSDRSPGERPAPAGSGPLSREWAGAAVEAVGRAGRPRLTLPGCENAEQEQGGHRHLSPDPTCSEQETRTRSAVPAPVGSHPWGRGVGLAGRRDPGMWSGPGTAPSLRCSRKGVCGCGRPPQAGAAAHGTSKSPCVFILSINGIFSNGDWEMDLVFKKKCGF